MVWPPKLVLAMRPVGPTVVLAHVRSCLAMSVVSSSCRATTLATYDVGCGSASLAVAERHDSTTAGSHRQRL